MFSITETVTPSRTGMDGKLKLFSALQMMQDCSEMWQDCEPVYRDYFLDNNMAQLVASRQVEVVRVPQCKERLTITTSIFDCMELFGFRNTIISDEAGAVCYKTWSTGAFVNQYTGRLSKLPHHVIDSLTIKPKYDMKYMDRKIIVPKAGYISHNPVLVNRDDIDYNLHMNNAHYVRIATEYLPDDFEVKKLRVEYKKPAKSGDVLYPHIASGDKGIIYILLTDDRENIFAVVEFHKNVD